MSKWAAFWSRFGCSSALWCSNLAPNDCRDERNFFYVQVRLYGQENRVNALWFFSCSHFGQTFSTLSQCVCKTFEPLVYISYEIYKRLPVQFWDLAPFQKEIVFAFCKTNWYLLSRNPVKKVFQLVSSVTISMSVESHGLLHNSCIEKCFLFWYRKSRSLAHFHNWKITFDFLGIKAE